MYTKLQDSAVNIIKYFDEHLEKKLNEFRENDY